jgi:hypothetical protein
VEKLRGIKTKEDEAAEEKARLVGIKAEGKQTRYLGINQTEALELFIDTRVWREQRQALYRTPQQIRGSLLLRLGIPPSPHISLLPRDNSVGNFQALGQKRMSFGMARKQNVPASYTFDQVTSSHQRIGERSAGAGAGAGAGLGAGGGNGRKIPQKSADFNV